MQPLHCHRNAIIRKPELVGEYHVKCTLQGKHRFTTIHDVTTNKRHLLFSLRSISLPSAQLWLDCAHIVKNVNEDIIRPIICNTVFL